MALTVSLVNRTVFGDKKISVADVTFDSSYATGGEELDLKLLGLNSVLFLQSQPKDGYQVEWDGTNKKLLVRATGSANKAAFTQLDSATDIATLVIRIMAYGS
ncbi:hypothetical protein [Cohnella panacarvi]|uniref:hypothetical protein n=1 Tax=Cohnella panacarvi TaxID=400776 RepID=UPI00047A0534|nr:hypothetical protein [Cohnella panacarvi]